MITKYEATNGKAKVDIANVTYFVEDTLELKNA